MTLHDVMMSRRSITWHQMSWQNVSAQSTKILPPKSPKITFFSTWRPWPMTLTVKLIRDIVKVNPSTKFWVRTSNGLAGRALTDGQTGPILYPPPLTREGKIHLFYVPVITLITHWKKFNITVSWAQEGDSAPKWKRGSTPKILAICEKHLLYRNGPYKAVC